VTLTWTLEDAAQTPRAVAGGDAVVACSMAYRRRATCRESEARASTCTGTGLVHRATTCTTAQSSVCVEHAWSAHERTPRETVRARRAGHHDNVHDAASTGAFAALLSCLCALGRGVLGQSELVHNVHYGFVVALGVGEVSWYCRLKGSNRRQPPSPFLRGSPFLQLATSAVRHSH